MQRQMLKSKIHRATITDCDVDYVGSITLDPELMRQADLLVNEQVHVWDIDNGARFVTYAIEGEQGSGTVQVNGAAARLVREGDKVIVASFGAYDEQRPRALLAGRRPRRRRQPRSCAWTAIPSSCSAESARSRRRCCERPAEPEQGPGTASAGDPAAARRDEAAPASRS